MLCWAHLSCASDRGLQQAEAVKLSSAALACINHQVQTVHKEKEAGAGCKEAIAALGIILATDPDCIAARFTDNTYVCKDSEEK